MKGNQSLLRIYHGPIALNRYHRTESSQYHFQLVMIFSILQINWGSSRLYNFPEVMQLEKKQSWESKLNLPHWKATTIMLKIMSSLQKRIFFFFFWVTGLRYDWKEQGDIDIMNSGFTMVPCGCLFIGMATFSSVITHGVSFLTVGSIHSTDNCSTPFLVEELLN